MLENYTKELNEVKDSIKGLINGLEESNKLVYEALKKCDKKKFLEAKSYIKNVSTKTDSIDNAIIKLLALYAPEASDLREVVAYLKMTNEIQRASTNTRSFIRGLLRVCDFIDKDAINEYALPLQNSTLKAIKIVLDMLELDCVDDLQEYFNEVLIEENKTDDLYELLERAVLKQSNDNFQKTHTILRAFRKSEKIADRAISMANLLVYIKVGGTMQRV